MTSRSHSVTSAGGASAPVQAFGAALAQRVDGIVYALAEDRRVAWVGGRRCTDVERLAIGLDLCDVWQGRGVDQRSLAELRQACAQRTDWSGSVARGDERGGTDAVRLELQPLDESDGQAAFLAIEHGPSAVDARALMQTMLTTLTEGVVVVHPNGRIVEANPAAAAILGLPEELLRSRAPGDARWQAVREDGSPLPGDEMPAMVTLRTGRAVRGFVHGVRTSDGAQRWVEVNSTPVHDRHGALRCVVATFADVTNSRERASRLRLLIDGAGLGTWDWDLPSGHVEFGCHWCTMLGYEPGELEPHVRTWRRILHPDDVSRTEAALTQYLRGERAEYRCEFRLLRKDGGYSWIMAAGAALERNVDGTPMRLAGVHVDITTERTAHEALRALRAEAEAANEQLRRTNAVLEQARNDAHDLAARAEMANLAKSEFLANVSHEIRTPLTAILGYAELLREEVASSPESQRLGGALETIHGAGLHLLTVLNDVLDLSKIEAGRMVLEHRVVPLPELLTTVVDLLRPRAHAKDVALSLQFVTPLPPLVLTDATRLRQILMNLLGNATKFTDEGRVDVLVAVEAATAEQPHELRVDIRDTGPGLDRDQAARLFRPFTQADAAVTRRHGGTGLGLVISRRLANLLGGDVHLVRSEPGAGSTFGLRIPIELVESEPGGASSATPSARPDAGNTMARLHGRILLVEDGNDNRRLLTHVLERAGATVTAVTNGAEALAALAESAEAKRPFDLVVTDLQMPVMDGYTLIREVRGSGGGGVPIVALTAHALAEDRERCVAAGCDDYAVKPIDRPQFLATCAHWLRTSRDMHD